MLIGMVACSSVTRTKLWSADGVEVFLMLLREQVSGVPNQSTNLVSEVSASGNEFIRNLYRACPFWTQDTSIQTGVLQALDTWLGEDLARVEGKLIQKDAVAALVDLYARSHQSQETQVWGEI